MKKKIAFISEHASPLAALGGVDSGGQNVYVDQVAKELAKIGYEIDIFTRWDNEKLPQVVNYQKGIRVVHIKAGEIKQIKKEELLPLMSEFTANMLSFIEEEDIDYKLIHANFFMSALVAADLKKILGVPFVVTFHALGKVRREFQKEEDKFSDERFLIEERVVKEADEIIAECPQDKEDLIYYYHANQAKISIVPCGFSPVEFHPIDKRVARVTLSLNPDKNYLLQLGRMVPRKGIDNVIEAFSLLDKKIRNKTELLIVGGESVDPDPAITPEIGRLQKIAKEKGVLDQVKFIGQRGRDQLAFYYNAADAFISTPWYEPFGITPLESMACGTPVIGARVGGIKFSVVDGKTGFLVEPKNPEELSQRMEEVLKDKKKARLFAKNSIKRVNSFFTWESVSTMLSSIYEKILYFKNTPLQEYQDQAEIVDDNFKDFISLVEKSHSKLRMSVVNTVRVISKCFESGGKVLTCGNGGSATDAQHFAAELVGHFKKDNKIPQPVISINTDSAIMTSIANDYSYDEVFSRQIEALGKPGDVLFAISTSGNSKNIIRALIEAKNKGMITIGLTGAGGGKMINYCDISLVVPSNTTERIQEIHTHIIHTVSELVEKQFVHEMRHAPYGAHFVSAMRGFDGKGGKDGRS